MTEQQDDALAEVLDDPNEGLGSPESYDGQATDSIVYDHSQFEVDEDA